MPVKLRSAEGGDPVELAESRFALIKARVAAGQLKTERARGEVEELVAEMSAIGRAGAMLEEQLRDWLK